MKWKDAIAQLRAEWRHIYETTENEQIRREMLIRIETLANLEMVKETW